MLVFIAAGAAGAVACRPAPVPQVHVRMLRAATDSTAYTVPAAARRCRGGGVVIAATEGAYGLLAWIHAPGGVTPGTYPLLPRGDTATARGAVVAVRFLTHEIAHGFTVDSGTLTLTAAGAWYRGRIDGRGLDAGFAVRTPVTAVIDSLSPAPDSVTCGAAP